MTIERYIRIIAGIFGAVSVVLGAPASPLFASQWFLAFTLFVGLNLLQFGFTNFCPLALVLRKLGVRESGLACAR